MARPLAAPGLPPLEFRPPDLFTIGYEGLAQAELLDIVTATGIDLILDVRAVPLSRKAGFSKTILGASLSARGVDYLHDRRLGTPKPGRDAARRGRPTEMAAIFATHMKTGEAMQALTDATALVQTRKVCLLCFERSAHDCHRGIVAAMIHARTGQSIRHL